MITHVVDAGFIPQSGPRLLFFSGGTALNDASRALADRFTHRAIHLLTPFDSGGSSATLREAFRMPAVGDVRARLLALSDPDLPGSDDVQALFSYRLPEEAPEDLVADELQRLALGTHPLTSHIPVPLRGILREHILFFARSMPQSFPLAGASIGNIMLVAGYLLHGNRLQPAAALYSRLLRVRGFVRPLLEADAHLAVRLENGQVLVGQHLFTGKGGQAPTSPIRDIWLADVHDHDARADVAIDSRIAAVISDADAICYPVGSFYSSVVANLLPAGVGRAVAANPGPKIYVPNLGTDPEQLGHDLRLQVERLLRPLLADAPDMRPRDMLTVILVDRERGVYPGGIPDDWLNAQGMTVRSVPLVREGYGPLAEAGLLAEALAASGALPGALPLDPAGALPQTPQGR
jgi:CofD-related protein of GAK system